MYSFHLVQKKEKQAKTRIKQQQKEKHWLKKYHSQVKPKLLQRYDARVNAFIRQIEEAPQDKSKIQKHYQSNNFRPFKLKSASSQHFNNIKNKQQLSSSQMDMSSIIRSSDYVPLSRYQYRERQKQKEIKPKIQLKILKYRKWQKESHLIASMNSKGLEDGHMSRMSARQFFRKAPEDNRSQIPSMYDDNQSLRFSVNDNIEGQARLYEKNQQLIERKHHFKRLANLEQVVNDARAKKSIHDLLVKGGITKPKIKTEGEELQIDLLKTEMEKQLRL